MNRSTRESLYAMVCCALMTALSVVLGRFADIPITIAGVFALNLSFGLAPVILSGLIFGPSWGFLTGFLADFIGAIAFPKGAYMPLFSLTYALAGFTPALITMSADELRAWIRNPLIPTDAALNRACRSYWRMLVSVAISQTLFSVGLNSLIISTLYGAAFKTLLPARLAAQLALIPLFTLVCHYLCKLYRQQIRKR